MATIDLSHFKNKTGIYIIINNFNGKKYIGQSVNMIKRIRVHLSGRGSTLLKNAMLIYPNYFTVEILSECSRSELNRLEEEFIEKHNTVAPFGYNLKAGGDSPLYISEETKQRLSESHKGIIPSKETVEKRRKAVIGQKRSNETKGKISKGNKGKIVSDETRQKLSDAHKGQVGWNKGKKIPKETIDKMIKTKTGSEAPWRWKAIIDSNGVVYKSIFDASKKLQVHYTSIHRVLQGTRKTLKKLTFAYYEGGVTSL